MVGMPNRKQTITPSRLCHFLPRIGRDLDLSPTLAPLASWVRILILFGKRISIIHNHLTVRPAPFLASFSLLYGLLCLMSTALLSCRGPASPGHTKVAATAPSSTSASVCAFCNLFYLWKFVIEQAKQLLGKWMVNLLQLWAHMHLAGQT